MVLISNQQRPKNREINIQHSRKKFEYQFVKKKFNVLSKIKDNLKIIDHKK